MPPHTGISLDRNSHLSLSSTVQAPNSIPTSKPASATVVNQARLVGQHLVQFCQAETLFSPSLPPPLDVLVRDDVTITMRKIVRQIVREKEPLFRGMVESVKPRDQREFKTVFSSIVKPMLEENGSRGLTWAKIVTIYAFGGLLANTLVDAASAEDPSGSGQSRKAIQRELGDLIGDVVVEVAGSWIQARGGWEDFVRCFGSLNAEETVSRKLLGFVGLSATLVLGLSLFNLRK